MVDWNLAQSDPMKSVQAGRGYVDQLYDQAAKLQAGKQYAGGDLSGASATLANRGDIAGAEKINTIQQGRGDEEYKYVANALPVLYQIAQKSAADPDGGVAQRGQAFDQIAQELAQKTGAPPQMIPQLKEAYAKDPKGFLARMDAQLPAEYKSVGKTMFRIRGNQAESVYTAPEDAPAGYRRTADNKLVYEEGGPADPKVIERTADTRRNVIINNPLPSQSDPRADRRLGIQYRKEFDALPEVKDFNTVANQYQTIKDLAARPGSAQDDMAIIFSFMKTLDSTSVVRETEYATAKNAAGVPERIRNMYNQAKDGQFLSPQQRKELASTAGSLYRSKKGRYDQIVNQYRGYVADAGLPESTIQPRLDPTGGAGPRVLKFNPVTGKLE